MYRTQWDLREIPQEMRRYFEEIEVPCGEPWRRVVEREADNTGYPNGPGGNHIDLSVVEHHHIKGSGGNIDGTLGKVARYKVLTLGFRPSCSCGCFYDPVPGVVLDIFAGSGTTLAVALEEGRDAIGIELNPAYIPLIEERLAAARQKADQVSLEFEEPTAPPPGKPVQLTLE